MKKAVMYGAGNIGRGFIGKTFSESGYSVYFIDIDKEIVDTLNRNHAYPVNIVDNEKSTEETVKNVYAVNGMDILATTKEICEADIMATAVGVNILPKIIETICGGLKLRKKHGKPPLNIIICENMIDADSYLRDMIERELGDEYKSWLDENLGLVEASIGRMVPVMTEKMKSGNPLRIWVEPYDELPVDRESFKGDIPKLNNLIPFSPFCFFLKRKLFIHNMGHAVCAYMGWKKGRNLISDCMKNDNIVNYVYSAMNESAKALSIEYGVSIADLIEHIDDLTERFKNTALNDTVERVGRDPIRKLGSSDRLVGAALNCINQNISCDNIIKGIAVALHYDNKNDSSAIKLQGLIGDTGIEHAVKEICGVSESHPLFDKIVEAYGSCIAE